MAADAAYCTTAPVAKSTVCLQGGQPQQQQQRPQQQQRQVQLWLAGTSYNHISTPKSLDFCIFKVRMW
jgi:hypothetical protein